MITIVRKWIASTFDQTTAAALEYGIVASTVLFFALLGFSEMAEALSNQLGTIGGNL